METISITLQHAATQQEVKAYKKFMRKKVRKLERMLLDEWLLELKREQREFGRSRLAQFGKTFPNRKRRVKPRPYWFRTRSFCVRSPYG